MTLQILDPDVVGKQYIEAFWKDTLGTTKDPANGQWYTNGPNNDNIGLYGGLTDTLPSQPDFDTANEQYIPTNETGTSGRVDNTDGLEPSATVTLGFSYQQGHSTTHETSASITAGVTQEIDLDFEVASSKTTFSFSGTYGWSQSSENSVTTTTESSIAVPVTVPTGKIYEAQLFYLQEQLIVPYTASVIVTGDSETWFSDRVQGHYNWSDSAADIFSYIGANGLAGDQSSQYGAGGNGGYGTVSESGTVTMFGGGAYTTKIFDVTNGGDVVVGSSDASASTAPLAATPTDYDALVSDGVGVKVRLGDGDQVFHDTRYDDYAIGGAGNDTFVLTGGSDVAEGNGGNDSFSASGTGTHIMSGGAGNDTISAYGTGLHNQLDGGDGNDLLMADAPLSFLQGGAGDDRYLLGPGAVGSIIVDDGGNNDLVIGLNARLAFERAGDSLIIHRDLIPGYQPDQDVAWANFFSGDGVNRVNGMTGEQLLARSPTPQPLDTTDFRTLAASATDNYAATGNWIA